MNRLVAGKRKDGCCRDVAVIALTIFFFSNKKISWERTRNHSFPVIALLKQYYVLKVYSELWIPVIIILFSWTGVCLKTWYCNEKVHFVYLHQWSLLLTFQDCDNLLKIHLPPCSLHLFLKQKLNFICTLLATTPELECVFVK